ncbi:MAG: GTPase, partial [Terriglobia bacterium]
MKKLRGPNRLVILGRPNVGKSTLFNRICGRRRSLVGNEPGMTRDRIYATAEWCGKTFEVIDTGGLVPQGDDVFAAEIFAQARTAMDEASQWLLVVDGQTGLTSLDQE